MKNVYYLDVSTAYGLTNQMFNIVSALLVNTNKIIIMNKFATELNGQCHKVVSEIFNIEK